MTKTIATRYNQKEFNTHLIRYLHSNVNSRDYEIIPIHLPEGFVNRSPQLLDRQLLKIKLKNGMNGLIVSDPKTPFASAAVSVDKGSWADGIHQGTAHFLEHMLFLGTKKYPKENDYERYLQDYNGKFNAFTASDHTHYYFSSLFPKAFEGGMDRFARFFYEPLFTESCVDREMNAVEQEFRRNLIIDGWRVIHVLKAISNQNHPFSQFNTGNLETMKLIDQDYLKDWYKKNYSANLMSFCILGAETQDKLVDIALKNFLPIQNNNVKNDEVLGPIFPESVKGKLVTIESIKDTRELSLMWEIPFKFNDKVSRPTVFLSRVLSQGTKNTLLTELKKRGLVQSISAYKQHLGAENLLYQISISLTKEGENKWEEVSKLVFGALEKLQKEEVPKYVFDEIYKLDKVDYQYQERYADMASTCCELIREEGIESFPRNSILIEKFDPKLIKELASNLLPEKATILLVTKNPKNKLTKSEKWMNTKYDVEELSSKSLLSWKNVNDAPRTIPEPNIFIPNDLVVKHKVGEGNKAPQLIVDSKEGKLYSYKDDEFLVPKSMIRFNIRTPSIRPNNAKSLALANLFTSFVNDSLTELSHQASMAGIQNSIWVNDGCGIGVSVDGYSEKTYHMFETITSRLFNMDTYFNEQQFEIFKDSYIRRHKNAMKNPPYQQVFDEFNHFIYPERVSHLEHIEVCEKLNLNDLKEYSKILFNEYLLESFVGGNISEEEAKKCWNKLSNDLKNYKISDYSKTKALNLTLPKDFNNKSLIDITRNLEVRGNSVMISTYLGPKTHKSWVEQNVLSAMISEPFYSDLRTKQQTGYIVSAHSSEQDRHYFLNCLVQSDTYDIKHLQTAILKFMDEFVDIEFKDTEDVRQRFNSVRESLLDRLHNIHDSLESKLGYFSGLCYEKEFLSNETPDFSRIESYINALNAYTFEEAQTYAKQVLQHHNTLPAGIGGRLAVRAVGSTVETGQSN